MTTEELYNIYTKHPSVQTDTRKLKPGDIFFALKGDRFNGNEFARQALHEGAVYSVIDEKEFEIPGKTILVDDVLAALQQLARYHRQQFSIPFLGRLKDAFGIPCIFLVDLIARRDCVCHWLSFFRICGLILPF